MSMFVTFSRKAVAMLALAATTLGTTAPAFGATHDRDKDDARTATPIKHLVVIFQENASFDHYFGTYPFSMNLPGEPQFHAKPNTPTVNGLLGVLLFANPNQNPANGSGAANPFRMSPSQAATEDMDHDYTPEQESFDGGLLDMFPKFSGTGGNRPAPPPAIVSTTGQVMGYFDGNTVTAMWNYAQHFAMSDNSFDTEFGPSTPGAINLISGQTNGAINNVRGTGAVVADGNGGLTNINDADPAGDICSTATGEVFSMTGKNIGDLLNAAGITWGFFETGFDLTITNANGTTKCKRSTTSAVTGVTKGDYIPHHQPFQYYASTANPTHVRPASVAEVGHNGPANHQYDLHDFFDAVNHGNFPAVSFLKAPGFQDGHPGYSDPLDEQTFIVNTLNALQRTDEWKETAVAIMWDDSDGWYDHQMGPLVNPSTSAADALTGPGACGNGALSLPGVNGTNAHAQGRCGYGPRLPFLIVSPWSRTNFVDHTITDQTSILRFVEDNWLNGQRIAGSFDAFAGPINQMFDFNRDRDDLRDHVLFLDPSTGERVH
ncbi:MAG TPA: alkaline phosphatase family protein [Candidatus Angelobacter sp.]|nr:alkaline phosphatase family protein [Candidatus Angelobacter sp.]